MILADKIIELRKKNGWSQEELAEQLQVSRQSVSKWESAQSIPDMNKIIAMSEIFGVSTDYLLKEEMELDPMVPQVEVEPTVITTLESELPTTAVSMEDANEYLSDIRVYANRIAWGVFCCILSPAVLILLGGLTDEGYLNMNEDVACGIGLVILLLLVVLGVVLFITTSIRYQKWEFLDKEYLDTAYGVDGMVRERKEAYREQYTKELVIGICLCILSVLPIFVCMATVGEASAAVIAAVSLLLPIVAVGVNLIVRTATIWGGFDRLLEVGDYSREKKHVNNSVWMRVFWALVIAIYLGVSFLTMRWEITWVIFAVAAPLSGIIAIIENRK